MVWISWHQVALDPELVRVGNPLLVNQVVATEDGQIIV
jgi:hypothetical protein